VAALFSFGREGVEILDLGAFAFREPRLYQTPEAKSVVHPHHAATVRALVVLVRGRWNGISKAVKIHFSPSQLLLVVERAPFVRCLKAIRWPEPLTLVMIDWTP
jgi:hypothetical protein